MDEVSRFETLEVVRLTVHRDYENETAGRIAQGLLVLGLGPGKPLRDGPTKVWWDEMTASDVSSARIDSKGRILLPPSLRSELDLEPGDSVSLKRTRVGLVVTPARKRDYLSKFRELIESPPKRTGKPRNPSPAQMKKIWKERLS